MIRIADMIDKAKESGYDEINAEAKVCQELILALIFYNRNVTIKGGAIINTSNVKISTANRGKLILASGSSFCL